MIELRPFGAGLGIIGMQLNKPVSPELMRAYWLAFRNQTDQPEWENFCAEATTRCGWVFLPTVPQLLDALREFRGVPPLVTEATVAYERVLESGDYNPEGGTMWTFRGVREKCGPAAAEAFQAAGGHSAFVTTWEEATRRERFVRAYQATARAEPAGRLIGPGQPLELGEGRQ